MVNAATVDLVKKFEGLELESYICPAGVLTVGYGHTGKDVKKGMAISPTRADELLEKDLAGAEAQVRKLVKVDLTENQLVALTSFVFNLGVGNLRESTLLKKLNAGDYSGAAGEFDKWVFATVKGVKTKLTGLVSRRKAEAALFMKGD